MKNKIIVCRCEEVTLREIKDAINDGALSVNGVKKRTRACMGMCQGRVCQPLIKEIIAREKGLKINAIETSTSRAPDRPVLLADIV